MIREELCSRDKSKLHCMSEPGNPPSIVLITSGR